AEPQVAVGGRAGLRQERKRLAEERFDRDCGRVLGPMALAHGVERAPDLGPVEAQVYEAARREIAAVGKVSALPRVAAFVDLSFDVLLAERLPRVGLVGGAASDAQVADGVRAAERARRDVVELEPGRRRAAMPFGIGEGAALAVTLEDRAPRRTRDACRLAR